MWIIIISVCAGCSVPAHAARQGALDGPRGSIRVVTDDNYPPYSFRDSTGRLQGILVDQWALWEKKTGIRVELTGMSWDRALAAMQSGQFDVIDSIFFDEERDKVFDFTKPYAKIDVSIFFSSALSGIHDVNSLRGFAVAVKKGDACVQFLESRGITDLLQYDSYESIVNDARQRKIDVFVMDQPPAIYFMHKANIQKRFNYSQPLYTGEFHRAVREGDAQTLRQVEDGFDGITKAEYEQINVKWQGTAAEYKDILPMIGYTAIGLCLVFLWLAGWNRALKIRVARRTAELEIALKRLAASESQNVAIIKAMPQSIFVLGNDGVVADCLSNADNSNLYMPAERFLGRLADVFPGDAALRLQDALSGLLASGEMQIVEFTVAPNDKLLYFKATMVKCDRDRSLMLLSNITQRKRTELSLYEMSIYDTLTHTYNRMFFEQTIARLEQGRTTGVGLLSCDLDGLKLINDTLGHRAGDEYIRLAADVLRGCIQPEDILARIGGDEFAVVVYHATEEGLEGIKDSIYAEIGRINGAGRVIPLSISIGYALWRDPAVALGAVFKTADDYMYRDKLNHMQSVKSKNVELLSKMLEVRDFNTEGHGDRLQALASKFARALGMPKSEEQAMMLLAQFHDIGKIGIPDTILLKPGRLTDEEMAAMRRHTEIGYRIALSSPDIMHIADWILKHHEGYDGGGYPFGLKGEEIPVQCRMLAIIDAYDAMTNDRPYRAALPREQAVEELRRCAGTQFDPRLTELFLTILEEQG